MGDLAGDSSSRSTNETTNNQIGLQAAPGSEQLGISGSSLANVSITTANPEIVKRALDLSESVANFSQANVAYALDSLKAYQIRASESVDKAVESAQTVALMATPQSPAVFAEISQNQTKTLLLMTGAGFALLLLTRKFK